MKRVKAKRKNAAPKPLTWGQACEAMLQGKKVRKRLWDCWSSYEYLEVVYGTLVLIRPDNWPGARIELYVPTSDDMKEQWFEVEE